VSGEHPSTVHARVAGHMVGMTITRKSSTHPMSTRYALVLGAFALLAVSACSAQAPPPHAGTGTTTTQHTTSSDAPTTGEAPGSATKQIPVPGGAPESTLAGTGIHIVSARSHVIDDVALSPGQCHAKAVDAASGKVLPDPTCTPGAVDPGVTQSNLPQTICRSGYSSSVRAPATETDKAKKVSLTQYGEQSTKTTEYDHLISLELGGTNATSNLWPEPNAAAATGTTNPKDSVENKLHTAICSGTITLVAAQKAIATDWTTALAAH